MQQHPENRGPGLQKSYAGRRAALCLLVPGIALELLYLALYPLLARAGLVIAGDPVQRALPDSFPWLPGLYWTRRLPGLAHLLARTPWFDPANTLGSANLLLILLALASIFVLLATYIGARAARGSYGRISRRDEHALFWILLLLTAIFGVTLLYAPIASSALSQDMLLYGLYGRMVVLYHANPYIFAPTTFEHSLLPGTPLPVLPSSVPYGPVWVDLSILAALPAHDSVASIVQGFRLIGLVAHMLNAVLLWLILAKLRPAIRIPATLLYAWNPLVLLLSVTAMHQEVVVIAWLLLAIFFFQRSSLVVGWIFSLLAVLTNPASLLLLPLFLHMMAKKRRMQRQRSPAAWWLGTLAISGLLVALTYAPYWQGWSLAGIAANISAPFWQGNALNSLDAALLSLPVQLPSPLAWLFAHHWSVVALIIIGIFLLLSLWLADTLELTLLAGGWLLLLQLALLPTYWPWYVLLPFVLALCSAKPPTILLAALLLFAALIGCYCWLRYPVWAGQGLVTLGLPLLLWGWTTFLTTTWQMMHRGNEGPFERRQLSRPRLSRPPWLSRPSRPGN